jgi:Fe-S-cluster-containing dehydrogenase component
MSKYRADKCDLCRDYAESNCVKECPTGALMRVQVDQQLAQLNTSLYDFLVYPEGKKTEEEQANLEPEPMPMSIPILTPLPAFMQSMTEGD